MPSARTRPAIFGIRRQRDKMLHALPQPLCDAVLLFEVNEVRKHFEVLPVVFGQHARHNPHNGVRPEVGRNIADFEPPFRVGAIAMLRNLRPQRLRVSLAPPAALFIKKLRRRLP